MARDDEFINTLINANPIESVVGSYVNLIRKNRNYVCSCPFHSEKTPSCTVFTDTQSFYCFGCGTGGDVISFVMKIENLDFTEAVKLLAQRSGLEVPERNSRTSGLAQRKTRIYEMNRLAANFFYVNLLRGKNRAGLQYFMNRRLSPQIIKKYGLGYASDSYSELTDMLRSKGYSEEEITDAWLGSRSQKNGRIYDIFRNRVMFPILDLRGNIIGFGGRVLDDSKPKYLNTGTTPVFDKGRNLFSLNHAKNSDSKHIILCEGYMDVIALNQAGFSNAVATLGTAITPDQARTISHYAEEVIISYDSDIAGQTAARRAINHFSEVGIKTRILRMQGAKDPDEYIKKFGAARFRMLIDGSDDANNYLLDRCEESVDMETEAGKVEFLRKSSELLAAIESPIEREVYISRTAKKAEISVSVLKSHVDDIINKKNRYAKKQEWRNIKTNTIIRQRNADPEMFAHKKEAKAEEMIICYLLKNPEDAGKIAAEAPKDIFITPVHKKLYSVLADTMQESENFSLSLLAEDLTGDEMSLLSGIEAKNRELSLSQSSFYDCVEVLRSYKPTNDISSGSNISDDELRELFSKKKK